MLSLPLVAAIAIAIIANAGAASLSTSTKWPSTVASAVPTQIHISYTQVPYELAVDFVSQDASGYVAFGTTAGGPFTTRASTSFNFSTIGFMHQAVMSFQGSAVGFYKVGSAGNESALFPVTLMPTRAERFAVIGDFGLRHDECMADLVQGAAAGAFDSVIHVGDWSGECLHDPHAGLRGDKAGDACLWQPRGMRRLFADSRAATISGELYPVQGAHARCVAQLQHGQ